MREFCRACLRPLKACFCSFVKTMETNAHFCILMHPKEARKEKLGTGRATHLFLSNSSLFIGESFDKHEKFQAMLADSGNIPMLLYPGEKSHQIGISPLQEIPGKRFLFIIIDGTWSCAKTLMRDSKSLHHLPRISFEAEFRSEFKIKQQPHPSCLSTIESVAKLIEDLTKQKHETQPDGPDQMRRHLQEFVNFHMDCAADRSKALYRSKPFTPAVKRKPAKKWNSRSIVFNINEATDSLR